MERFNTRVRDELLAVEIFSCLPEAKVMVEDYRQDYNRHRPHRAHGLTTPAACAQGWRTADQAAPASAELHGRHASAPFDAGGSLTPAATNQQVVMLAARLHGLGTCWTTVGMLLESELAEVVGVPLDRVTIGCLTPVAHTLGSEFRPALRPDPAEGHPLGALMTLDT